MSIKTERQGMRVGKRVEANAMEIDRSLEGTKSTGQLG